MAAAFFPRDELKGFRRWELPEVGEPKPAEPAPEPPATLPTVADLEGLEREAREAGYAAGLAEGRAAAREALHEQAVLLEGILRAAARPLDALDDATEQELARLALVIARQVIGQELKTSPALVARTVRQAALALPSAARTVRVYLHPDDLMLLRELEASEADWQLVADVALQRGDCRVETDTSRLDARVETRLAAVAEAVLGDESGGEDPELEMA